MTTPTLNKVNNVIEVTNPKFVFQHQGNEIVWVLHLLTGVKTLYLNGELLKRDYTVWCRSGQYDIPNDTQPYKLRIRQDSSATFAFNEVNAPLEASLELGNQIIETRRYSINAKDVTKHLGYSIVAGLFLGFCLSHLISG